MLVHHGASAPILEITLAPKGPLAPKGALDPEGAPAHKGASVGSPSAASMDVHVGSLMPRTNDVGATSSIMPIEPSEPTTLELSGSGAEIRMGTSSAEIPMGASGAEIPMGVTLSLGDLNPSTLVPARIVAYVKAIAFGGVSVVLTLGFPYVLLVKFAGTCISCYFVFANGCSVC